MELELGVDVVEAITFVSSPISVKPTPTTLVFVSARLNSFQVIDTCAEQVYFKPSAKI